MPLFWSQGSIVPTECLNHDNSWRKLVFRWEPEQNKQNESISKGSSVTLPVLQFLQFTLQILRCIEFLWISWGNFEAFGGNSQISWQCQSRFRPGHWALSHMAGTLNWLFLIFFEGWLVAGTQGQVEGAWAYVSACGNIRLLGISHTSCFEYLWLLSYHFPPLTALRVWIYHWGCCHPRLAGKAFEAKI